MKRPARRATTTTTGERSPLPASAWSTPTTASSSSASPPTSKPSLSSTPTAPSRWRWLATSAPSHYQGFALQPLVVIAELATRQGVDLYAYSANGHTLRDAIVFFGRAVDDPSLILPYTPDEQMKGYGPDDFAPFVFYAARYGISGLPPSIVSALQHPAAATRIGGSTTVLAAK